MKAGSGLPLRCWKVATVVGPHPIALRYHCGTAEPSRCETRDLSVDVAILRLKSFALKLNDPSDGGTAFGDDAQFVVEPNGALAIASAGEVTHYASTYWQAIQTRNNYKPGAATGRPVANPVRVGNRPLGS